MKTVTILSAAAMGVKLGSALGTSATATQGQTTTTVCSKPPRRSTPAHVLTKSTGAAITEPWRGKEDILHEGLAGNCVFWAEGNCKVSHCWTRDDNDGTPMTITQGYAQDMAGGNHWRCSGLRAGGKWNGARDTIEMIANEDQGLNSKAKRDANGNIEPTEITIEEWEQLKNDTIHRGSRTAKRQAEDDDVVDIDFVARGVRHPTEYDQGAEFGRGVGYTYKTENSRTFSVTTTVSLGGAWNIFTASIGTEISESETFSISEELTFDIDCRGRGQVTFYPFYDYYQITSWPSGTHSEIWIPASNNGYSVNGEIAVVCQG